MAGERVRIAILPDEIVNKKTNELNYGHTGKYPRAVRYAGGLPSYLDVFDDPAEIEEYYDDYAGFILSGGLDVNPSLYGGEEGLPHADNGDIRNDNMAIEFVKRALSPSDPKPVLAICRGLQIFNVALGGTLHQHLPDLRQPEKAVNHRDCHDVEVLGGTLLADTVEGAQSLRVNSRHHQAVKDLGRGLIVAARAPDGVIEAVESPGHPFAVGVQWHEEELGEPRLFRRFIEAARQAKYGGLLLREAA